MRMTWATIALAVMAGAAFAVPCAGRAEQIVATPDGCHWAARADGLKDLWCKDLIGDQHRTGQTLTPVNRPASDSGCRSGPIYDGAACVSEAQALREAEAAPGWAPTRFHYHRVQGRTPVAVYVARRW
jgi:hypothetical protein